ncbi:MAG: helix-turn-helix domain-containing protein [Bacteroidales bacterium]
MNEITFELLPQAVHQLFDKLENIERLLLSKSKGPQPEVDELLTVQDTAKFLSLSVPTIYGLISKGELPVMKRSKRCYFSKIELLNYLRQGRKKTLAETASEANQYLNKKKGLNNEK